MTKKQQTNTTDERTERQTYSKTNRFATKLNNIQTDRELDAQIEKPTGSLTEKSTIGSKADRKPD